MSYSKRKLSVTKKSRSKDAWGYTTEDLPSLRRKRTLAYNRLTKAYEVATLTTNDPSQIELFLSYYQEIKKIAGTFEEAHLTILDLVDEPEEDELICTRFDDMYYEIIRIHRSITKSISQNSESALEHINSQTTSSHVKLPKITLPSFSGNIKEWPKFIATYDNLIHNARLSDTDKFNYLTSVLQGDALALIRTFPATGDHYSDAYTKLVTRYESKRDLAFTCWRDILNADFKLHNAHDFRRSLDMFDENLTILKRLNLPVDQWDFVLSYHILSKLDPKLRREFEEKHPNIELPSYADLQSFLYSKCEALIRDTHFTESGHLSSNPLCSKEQYTKPNPNIRSIKPKASHSLVAAQDCTDNDVMCGALVASHSPQPTPPLSKPVLKCTYCSDVHSITSCKSFIQNTVDERINIARNNKWCFNCLRTSHTIRDCKSIFSCQKCKHRHHTLLHKDVEPAPASPSHTTLITRHEFACTSPTVLLATAIVYVRNSLGDSLAFRAVFDTGSQNNFITQKAADRLCFTPRPASVNITGIGGTEALINGVVRCNLGTACTPLFELEMLVIPKICSDQPMAKLNSHGWSNIKTLQLADPGFDIPGPVDILLGADVFAESLLNERIKGQGSQPPALRSVFGWLLLGKTSVVHSSLHGIHATTDSEQLTSIVQRFWDVDSVPQASIFTPQEQLCERKYVSEHSRDSTGRYVVTLPFKDDSVPVFSGSRDIAWRRFFALERRLSRDPDLRAQYVEIMDDYLNSGHMSLVPRTKLGHGRYYIPHHGILKPSCDSFVFDVAPMQQPCTKRNILSELARIFDPLGFLSPLTIQAKCLIQRLWIIGIPWDETPPHDVLDHWLQYLTQLPQLKRLRFPRCVNGIAAPTFELHGFCDASERAYGAVIYIRVFDHSGTTQTFLLCAKARVAPIKQISLPRLELCAAVLLVQLTMSAKTVSRLPLKGLYLWSDSTIVLSWLRSHSSRWTTFVANRVSFIQDSVPTASWRHVPTSDNPAELCSRGLMPTSLVYNTLWWAGPSWLSQSSEAWPANILEPGTSEADSIQLEQRSKSSLLTEASTEPAEWIDELFLKNSSLDKILNTIGYIYRFVNNMRRINPRHDRVTLTDGERRKALHVAVRFYQDKFFREDIAKLKNHQALPKWLRKLTPFIDSEGILRVGGRISRSGLEYDHKHPALLPTRCPLTTRYIRWVHRKHCHTGINTTHYLILQQFWIVAAKRVIRQQLAQCVRCFKTRPESLQPVMSDLPSYRINQVKAFSVVGVDFGGPFRIKLGKHRGAKLDIAYLCLFVCLTTKAVHLEVASSLSTDAFLATLRMRFVARRGRCSVIHADCGTNFIGTRNQLCSLMGQAAQNERIEFKFNPPSAPHFGGVWEIQIKSAKSHLHRVIGEQVLTFEELTTLFTQIEAVLNSRPLCPLSSDPNDLTVLTPGNFLTLEPLTSVPEHDFTTTNLNRLNRWQLLQAFQQHFWMRWKNEYLHSLTQRAKWTKDCKPLPLNSIVIIKDDNRTPLQWSLGRVVDVHPGPDGIIRCASIRMANQHVITRPLVKLCPLPTS